MVAGSNPAGGASNYSKGADVADASYADKYRGIDFRAEPHKYVIGRGEQGVLVAEPYKSEILPLWRFKTEAVTRQSAADIYACYEGYRAKGDFVGMDMARKFLQMGFTRARRYANHAGGTKYDGQGAVLPQAADAMTFEKAAAACVFKKQLEVVRADPEYARLKDQHMALQRHDRSEV